MPPRACLLSLTALLLAACARPPAPPAAPAPSAPPAVQQAWVQAVNGGWVVRALTSEAECPALRWPGGQQAMQLRSAPQDLPPPPGNTQPERKPSSFKLRACEAPWPGEIPALQVGAIGLRAPGAELHRVVVLGDTGCRLKASENEYQACNDAGEWPFARVLAQALQLKPDLVVHVGDYHYRESPCPAGMAGCAGSPWGYGDDTWQADFFRPAQALLAAAPWVFVRGNHEACNRAGQGWLRYLDPHPGTARSCDAAPNIAVDTRPQAPGSAAGANAGDFTEPFAVPLSPRSQLIVFDSSAVGSRTPAAGSPAWARWRAQLDRVDELTGQSAQSLFVNHHPSLAFSPSALGVPGSVRSGLTPLLQDAHPGRLFPGGVQATLHGHIHVHELLGFSTNHPASLVIGNGGSAASGRLQTGLALRSEPLPGVKVESFQSHAEFGFSLLTATPEGWQIQAFNTLGQPLGLCRLAGQKLRC